MTHEPANHLAAWQPSFRRSRKAAADDLPLEDYLWRALGLVALIADLLQHRTPEDGTRRERVAVASVGASAEQREDN